jgi:hypothetical protein
VIGLEGVGMIIEQAANKKDDDVSLEAEEPPVGH